MLIYVDPIQKIIQSNSRNVIGQKNVIWHRCCHRAKMSKGRRIHTLYSISSWWFCKDIVQKYIQYHDTARGHSFCPEQGALCYTSRPKHGVFPSEDIESMHGRVVMGTHWTALKWQCYVIFLDFFCLSWIEPYYWKYFRFCGDICKTKDSVCRDFLQNCFCRWIRSLDGFDDAYIKTII